MMGRLRVNTMLFDWCSFTLSLPIILCARYFWRSAKRLIKAYLTEGARSIFLACLPSCIQQIFINFVLGFLGMIYFSFLFKMLFSALYLISAIFAEIPQRVKFRTLLYSQSEGKSGKNQPLLVKFWIFGFALSPKIHLPLTPSSKKKKVIFQETNQVTINLLWNFLYKKGTMFSQILTFPRNELSNFPIFCKFHRGTIP